MCIGKERIVQKVQTGHDKYSLTKQFTEFTYDNFHVSDTMGLNENGGLNIDDIGYTLKGHMPNGYRFDQQVPFTEDSRHYKANPTNADMVHCVAFCIGADLIASEMPPRLREKCIKLIKAVKDEGIPLMVVLTKIDNLCEKVGRNLKRAFKSISVKNAVRIASETLDVDEMYIHPVKNFTKEMEPTTDTSILLLHALKHAALFSNDYIEGLKDEI